MSANTDIWETLRAIKEAVDFIHSNLRDAGVEFENESEIIFWKNVATEQILANVGE